VIGQRRGRLRLHVRVDGPRPERDASIQASIARSRSSRKATSSGSSPRRARTSPASRPQSSATTVWVCTQYRHSSSAEVAGSPAPSRARRATAGPAPRR
jgi:hypothetical protein